jgi:ribonuclease HI/fatty acid desaturase
MQANVTFSRALLEIGQRSRKDQRQDVFARDLRSVRGLKLSTRIAEVTARAVLHFGSGPISWIFGSLTLAYYFAVEAQINHTVMHGAFKSAPNAKEFDPKTYESLALPFQSRTWGDAHHVHHQTPSVLGADPDTVHPLFRVHTSTTWKPWHRLNAFLGSLTTFECWSYDYDSFLKNIGKRDRHDQKEFRKFAVHVLYQYVLFPLLAGAQWKFVLTATLAAAVLRNLIFTGLQTASSVGHQVSTIHAQSLPERNSDAWFRFQIQTSKNFGLPLFWRKIFGGLDRHIEHHLYPDLPPTRLHALSSDVRALCQAHNVRYEEFPSFWSSLGDSLRYLHKLARKGAGPKLHVYTDGSVKNGMGAWAFVIVDDSEKVILENSGAAKEVEATRMEIIAAIQAVQNLATGQSARIYSDSRILVDAMSKDLDSWQTNGWTKPNGKPHPYRDLLMDLSELCRQREITWKWVKAHAGNPFNERCDLLCREARETGAGTPAPT